MKKIKKNKFNLLDAVVVIILLSIMVAAYLKTNHRELTMMNVKESEVILTLNAEVSDESKDYNKLAGTELYLADYNQKIGTVESVITNTNNFDDNSTIKEVGIDYKKNTLTITLNDVKVKKSDERGYYLNGSFFIAKGKSVSIITQDGVILSAVIDNISENG